MINMTIILREIEEMLTKGMTLQAAIANTVAFYNLTAKEYTELLDMV